MKAFICKLCLATLFFLLASGCSKKPELKYDLEDFWKATWENDIETMRICVEMGNVPDIGYELLSLLGFNDTDLEAVKFMLDRGADPNYMIYENNNNDENLVKQQYSFPLSRSALKPELTRTLIDYGANANMLVEPNANLLMFYIDLLDYWGGRNRKGDILASMRLLLENGADASFRGGTGLTPLLVALNYGQKEAARLLLEYVEPSPELVRIDFDYDPLGYRDFDEEYGIVWQSDFLMLANNGMHDELMPYIEKGIISPDHATPDGHDMYYLAAEGGDAQTIMRLLPYLGDINARRYEAGEYANLSLLHIAAMHGRREAAKALLANGIDPEGNAYYSGTDHGRSAMQLAWNHAERSGVDDVIYDFIRGKEDYAEYRVGK